MMAAEPWSKHLRDFRLLSGATWTSSRREFLLFSRDRLARSLILGAVAGSFLVAVFGLCLLFFSLVLSLGNRAGWQALDRLGQYGLAILFCMMLYSSLLTTLHALFSDSTLPLLWSSPVGWCGLWWNRVFVIMQRSGWMVAGFILPVLVALGVAAGSSPEYYATVPVVLIALGILPCALGIALGLLLVYLLPPRRLQQALVVLGLLAGMVAVVAFQHMRLERILSERNAVAVTGELLALRPLPGSVGAPLAWAAGALLSAAETGAWPWRPLGLLLFVGALCLLALHGLGGALFYRCWSRNLAVPQTAHARRNGRRRFWARLSWPDLGNPIIRKDARVFFRELEQWSSLAMVLPLLLLCVGNMKLIFASVPSPQPILGWLNLLVCGLVVGGVGARILYPCFSMEGPAFWNTMVAPLPAGRLLWSKFIFYSVPLVGAALLLTVANNLLFQVHGALWGLSLFTSGVCAITLCAMGVAFAAAFPHFGRRQISQVVLSMGGLYYMLAAFAYVALLGVLWCLPFLSRIPDAREVLGPYAALSSEPWLWAGACLSMGLSIVSMLLAHRALSRLEWRV